MGPEGGLGVGVDSGLVVEKGDEGGVGVGA